MSPKCKCATRHAVGQVGGGKEVFVTAADSLLYCTHLSSPHTILHACTNKIPRLIIKIQYVYVCAFIVFSYIHCDRAPPIHDALMCILV